MGDRTLSDWATAEMDQQGLTTVDPNDPHDPGEWFCLASGCLNEKRDSYGECIDCGEPVVRVWMRDEPTIDQEGTP